VIGPALVGLARFLVGGHAEWVGAAPEARPRIYYANHASHLDALLVWGALPAALRRVTHPAAAEDYWGAGPLRRWVAERGLNAVLISRSDARQALRATAELLSAGRSLIIFPEGTRGTERLPLPFRAGLHRLALDWPEVEMIPTWLENPARAFPRGALLPVPITCTIRFGAPLPREAGEAREAFLARAHAALVALAPPLPA
jgi:1-acyl-sn-glycerol-3-phosphate acyltransferase